MIAPIFLTVLGYAPATAVLGDDPLRFYAFGEAPQDETRPYATFQVTNGSPENYVNQRPDMDMMEIQVDAYAETGDDALLVAQVIRDAIEDKAYVTIWRSMGRDTATRLYRFTFKTEWFTPR